MYTIGMYNIPIIKVLNRWTITFYIFSIHLQRFVSSRLWSFVHKHVCTLAISIVKVQYLMKLLFNATCTQTREIMSSRHGIIRFQYL